MNTEFGPSCQECEARPACEVAAQNAAKLEVAARELGFTIVEGSITCVGRDRLPEPFNSFECRARYHGPKLASDEEREIITKLADLDERAQAIWPGVNEHVREVRAAAKAQ